MGFELERKEGGFIVSSFVSELRALRLGRKSDGRNLLMGS